MTSENNKTNVYDQKAITPQCLIISSEYYDPVELPCGLNVYDEKKMEITEKSEIIVVDDAVSKFKGYFGFPRWSNELKTIRKHTGYDYIAKVGETDVKAVHHGTITKIRFGKKGAPCRLKDYFIKTKSLSFLKKDIEAANFKYCDKDCNSGCFGLQVFLELSGTNYVAFYAHLSVLDHEVFDGFLNGDIDMENTLILSTQLNNKSVNGKVIDGNTNIGKCGDTGNAIFSKDKEKHLHFECREKPAENGSQISPNKIVKTEFFIKNTIDPNKPLIEEIDKVNFIEYSTQKDIIKKEIENRTEKKITEAISEKIQCIINDEWKNTETFIRRDIFFNKKWLEDKSNKCSYDAWEWFDRKWNENIKKKSGINKGELWKQLFTDNNKSFDEIEYNKWKNKKKELSNLWQGSKNNKGKDNMDGIKWKEYNDFKKIRSDKERRENEETYKQEIKSRFLNQYISESKTEIMQDKKWWNIVKKEQSALEKFKKDHILIIGKIKGKQNNIQIVSTSTTSHTINNTNQS